jgi:hypothetical protein
MSTSLDQKIVGEVEHSPMLAKKATTSLGFDVLPFLSHGERSRGTERKRPSSAFARRFSTLGNVVPKREGAGLKRHRTSAKKGKKAIPPQLKNRRTINAEMSKGLNVFLTGYPLKITLGEFDPSQS